MKKILSQTQNFFTVWLSTWAHYYYCNNNRYSEIIGLQNNIVECVFLMGVLIRTGLCWNCYSIVPNRHSFSAHSRCLNHFIYGLRWTIIVDFANTETVTIYEGKLCISIYVRAEFYMYFARHSNRWLCSIYFLVLCKDI